MHGDGDRQSTPGGRGHVRLITYALERSWRSAPQRGRVLLPQLAPLVANSEGPSQVLSALGFYWNAARCGTTGQSEYMSAEIVMHSLIGAAS